jgi:integrase
LAFGLDELDAIPEREVLGRYPYALAAYADLHASLGNLDEARAYLDRALANQSSPAQHALLKRKRAVLLYATGLRISEALALKRADVDLAEAILTIRETKFYKSRLVPIGADLVGVLRHYRDQWDGKRARGSHDPFLSDHQGRPILRQTAELVFKRVREQAGLERPMCRSFQPRLHDFRHTFAMNRLVSWYREGKNVQRLLPHLSTYLGHRSVNETQRYLNMTADLTMEAGLRFLKYAIPGGPHEDA